MTLEYVSANDNWGTIKTSIMSQYLGRVGSIFDDAPSSVTELTLGYKGWYAGIWTATTYSGESYGTTYGDEIDFYAGWAHTFCLAKLDIMYSYYTIADLDQMDDDLWAIESEISFPRFPFVQPYIRSRYFGEVGDTSPKGGMFYFGGLRKTISLSKTRLDRHNALHLEGSTAYAGGALKDVTGLVYARLATSLDVSLGKRWTLSPSIIFQKALSEHRNNLQSFTDGDKWVFGLTLAYKF